MCLCPMECWGRQNQTSKERYQTLSPPTKVKKEKGLAARDYCTTPSSGLEWSARCAGAVRGSRVLACVRPYIYMYVTEGVSLLRKWRHSSRTDHDVICGRSLRWGIRRVQTALSGVCKMHRVIGRVYCKRAKINCYRP